jgi:ribonuclease-3
MSHPRLQDSLQELFEARDPEKLKLCLEHPDFQNFLTKFGLPIPLPALVLAFTHTSFAHEYSVAHQEQLEFLGDAVLQLILTEELVKRFPAEPEGRLSKMRSTLVNEKSLARIARSLNLSELLLVGKGEYKKELYRMDTVLADTVEALLAQIYRHMGMEKTKSLFFSWLEKVDADVWSMKNVEAQDPKSLLQEKSLAKYKKLPEYSAEARGDQFLVKLLINEVLVGEGLFPSKKSGEKELAAEFLKSGMI